MLSSKLRGEHAEERAAAHLRRQGLQILERNYRCRGGEIDLICNDSGQLVFVEVRFRSRGDFGGALESIDCRKQRRLIAAARHYLAGEGRERPCRFDVVAITAGELQWLRDAFQA